MNWDAIGAIGQILGSVGVFVSLGYLALQTRLGAAATRHASQNAFIADYNAFLTNMRDQPGFLALIAKGWEEADAIAREQIHLFAVQQYLSSFNMWLQMRSGQFDPRLATPLIHFFAAMCKSKGAEAWWALLKLQWNNEFTRYIDSMISDPKVPTLEQLQPWWLGDSRSLMR